MWRSFDDLILIFNVLTSFSPVFQLYHGDQFWWWRKPEYPERTTDPGQETGKLYYLRCESSAPYCNLQSRARSHVVLAICLYAPLDPKTQLIELPGPRILSRELITLLSLLSHYHTFEHLLHVSKPQLSKLGYAAMIIMQV